MAGGMETNSVKKSVLKCSYGQTILHCILGQCLQISFLNGIFIEAAYTVTVSAFVFLMARPIMELFIDKSSVEVIDMGVSYMRVIAPLYLLSGSGNIVQGFFRGIGNLKVTLISSILNISVRVVSVFFMVAVADGSFSSLALACGLGWMSMNLLEIPLIVKRMKRI